uniref:Pimeloyl-ACP methyl ester carboxylesterase n=1 Tax=Candidatus Kentrum sp. TC TaxID=2126339 RepID=A0A450YSC3_9GAMM|nr:MAG: Pimeloyl-ACP methyl ester carboxylesterase [Candidatus Kentron sp. TC]
MCRKKFPNLGGLEKGPRWERRAEEAASCSVSTGVARFEFRKNSEKTGVRAGNPPFGSWREALTCFRTILEEPESPIQPEKIPMKLEMISRLPETGDEATPLLFLHGAFCGAWVWDEHFLSYFAEHGFAAHAVSLRGHGKSDGYSKLPFTRLADYVDDLTKTIHDMEKRPILIGHSMGGVIGQLYLRDHILPGAVLMGSGPPHGMIASAATTFLRSPIVSTQLSLMHIFGSDATSRNAMCKIMFSNETPREAALDFLRRTQPESYRVVFDLSWPYIPRNRGTPLLVLGAENDFFVAPYVVRATAKAYKLKAEIFPKMGHAMMAEVRWREVADRIMKWIREQSPSRPAQG